MKPAYDLKYNSEDLYTRILELENKLLYQEKIIKKNEEKIDELNAMIDSLSQFDTKETDLISRLMQKVDRNKNELTDLTHMINVISKILDRRKERFL